MLNTAELIKNRIYFDPLANARAKGTKLPVIQIPSEFWGGLQPMVKNITPNNDDPLPNADVLIITWTVAETQGLSAVFTSSRDYAISWHNYEHQSAALISQIPAGVVKETANKTLQEGIVGYYQVINLNGKTVVLFKSELHPADDGGKLPIIGLVQQIVNEVKPSLLITTGTAGANGSYLQAGDAVITDAACFYLINPKSYPAFPNLTNKLEYTNTVAFKQDYITKCNTSATDLVLPTLQSIAKAKNYAAFVRNPQIFYKNVPGATKYDAVSSDGFTMDDVAHTMGLQLLGIFNEMNDAYVAYALNNGLGSNIPSWLSIRNMSEPEAPDLSAATKNEWGEMYMSYSLYTTYNSAFACWSVICGL